MRTTQKMVDFQLNLINEKLKGTNKKIRVYSAYGHKNISISNIETTGEKDLRCGLTLGQLYDILYMFNELNYQIEKAIKENK